MSLKRLGGRIAKRLSRLWPERGPRVMQTAINGYDLLVLANEEVGRAIHYGRDFEREETEFLRRVIADDAVCIDVGANVGYFTLLMSRCAPHGEVHAFEPQELNAALLRASVALNACANVSVVESAVGAAPGVVELVQSTDSAYSSLHDTGRKAVHRRVRVPMTTIDHYVQARGLPRVDVLKADVEGAEGLVIDGARELLDDPARRPSLVMLELYGPNLAPFGTDVAEVIGRMRGLGYAPHVLEPVRGLIPAGTAPPDGVYNVFFIPRGGTANG